MSWAGFPRLRGDEPSSPSSGRLRLPVFPAYAGMSRPSKRRARGPTRFPRLRGDEPATERAYLREEEFSPPTRG